MNIVWSYDSNGYVKFTKAELYVILASVLFWKKNNPNDKRMLFCDNLTKEYFKYLKIDSIWDEIIEIEDISINKEVFWAYSKIIAISKVPSPLVHIDLDFFTWTKFSDYNFFSGFAGASFEESTDFYYPINEMMKGIVIRDEIKLHYKAYNTSLFYIGTDILKNRFCEFSIEYMIKASYTDTSKIFDRDKSQYMIFAEQVVFASEAKNQKIPVKTLIKEKLITGIEKYVIKKDNFGIFTADEAENHLVHLGDFKKDLINEKYSNAVIQHVLELSSNAVNNDDKKYFELLP